MPAHQMGFRKYERLSEACAPYAEFKAASFKPYKDFDERPRKEINLG